MPFGSSPASAAPSTGAMPSSPDGARAAVDYIRAGGDLLSEDFKKADHRLQWDDFVIAYEKWLLSRVSATDENAAYWAGETSLTDLQKWLATFRDFETYIRAWWHIRSPDCSLPEESSIPTGGIARLHTATALLICIDSDQVEFKALSQEHAAYSEWFVGFLDWRAKHYPQDWFWTSGGTIDAIRGWETQLINWRNKFHELTGHAPASTYQELPAPSQWLENLGKGSESLLQTAMVAGLVVGGIWLLRRPKAA